MKLLDRIFKAGVRKDELSKWLRELELSTGADLVSKMPDKSNQLTLINILNLLVEQKAAALFRWQMTVSEFLHAVKDLKIAEKQKIDFAALEDSLDRIRKKDVYNYVTSTNRMLKDHVFLFIQTKNNYFCVVVVPKKHVKNLKWLAKETGMIEYGVPAAVIKRKG